MNRNNYICNMLLTEDQAKNKYGIEATWKMFSSLDSLDLYSGGPNDPIVIAQQDIISNGLNIGLDGIRKPYEIIISLFPVDVEEGESIYEMNGPEESWVNHLLWKRQIVETKVILFSTFEDYVRYRDDNVIITTFAKEEK